MDKDVIRQGQKELDNDANLKADTNHDGSHHDPVPRVPQHP